MKPTKCPAKGKKMRKSERRGEERKREEKV